MGEGFARRRAWLIGGIAAAIVVIAGGALWAVQGDSTPAASPTPPPSSATPSPTASAGQAVCTAKLVVTNQWDGGFQGNVVITAAAPLSSWTVTVPLGKAVVNDAWNTDLAVGATGPAPASGLDYNSTVAAGAGAEFGFVADGTPPAEGPIECTGVATGPVPTSSPSPLATPPTYTSQSGVRSPTDDDWLHTDGNRIVDADGNPVWLTGANWYGFNLEQRVLNGLQAANLDDLMDQIASRGINVIRVPVATELLLEWRDGKAKIPGAVNTAMNPDLAGKNTLEVFDALLADAKDRGVKIIVDVHSAEVDDAGHLYPVWYRGEVSTADFVAAWKWMASRYKDDDTIIGFDLKNEPHGQPSEDLRAVWDGGKSANNWRHAAELAGNAVLKINPHLLVFVEGIEATPKTGTSFGSTDNGDYDFGWWGGNLRMADDFPVRLNVPNQLVYSPHDYGPLVYDQPYFQKPFTAQTLRAEVWEPNWLFLHDDGTAPLMIGEWGGRLGQDARQDKWMTALRDLIVSEHLAYTFWCLNPESGDTGGLFADGWQSWDEKKYALLKPALWQDRDGKFVSLDHVTALPGGVSISEYYAAGNPAPE